MARTIDWIALFEQQGIEYATRGNNVKKGDVNIACPFCADDPSQHLGVNLETGYWSCWRNRAEHKGKRPHRLLMKLLGLPYSSVERMLLEAPSLPDGFERFVEGLSGGGTEGVSNGAEHVNIVPEHFHPMIEYYTSGMEPAKDCTPEAMYLRRRGFSVQAMASFGLMYSTNPQWKDRVIIPYREDGRVVAWSGRSIRPRASIRYLASTPDTVPGSLKTPDVLFNADEVSQRKMLVVTEGPFDAMNVHWIGRTLGVGAVALSTLSISERQLAILVGLIDACEYDKIAVALDSGASRQADLIVRELAPFGDVRRYDLPAGYEDPAELPHKEVVRMVTW